VLCTELISRLLLYYYISVQIGCILGLGVAHYTALHEVVPDRSLPTSC